MILNNPLGAVCVCVCVCVCELCAISPLLLLMISPDLSLGSRPGSLHIHWDNGGSGRWAQRQTGGRGRWRLGKTETVFTSRQSAKPPAGSAKLTPRGSSHAFQVGTLSACFFAKRGFRVEVFEAREGRCGSQSPGPGSLCGSLTRRSAQLLPNGVAVSDVSQISGEPRR